MVKPNSSRMYHISRRNQLQYYERDLQVLMSVCGDDVQPDHGGGGRAEGVPKGFIRPS